MNSNSKNNRNNSNSDNDSSKSSNKDNSNGIDNMVKASCKLAARMMGRPEDFHVTHHGFSWLGIRSDVRVLRYCRHQRTPALD